MNSNDFIDDLLRKGLFHLEAAHLDETTVCSKLLFYLGGSKKREAKIVTLVGGAASGKSTLARNIASGLGGGDTVCTDDFALGDRAYRRRFKDLEGVDPLTKYDFDLLREKVEKVKSLRSGEYVCFPSYGSHLGTGIPIEYDQVTGEITSINRETCARKIGQVNFLIVEGDFQVLESPDYQIYLHVPDDVRLKNRIRRDLRERGLTTPGEITQSFNLRQKLQHLPYTLTNASTADMLLIVMAKPSTYDTGYEYEYSCWVSPSKKTSRVDGLSSAR
jgi:uridine kinase